MIKNVNILSADGVEQIHETALRVLEEVGIKFHNEEAQKIFKDAGASVEGPLVKIPRALVNQALETAPSEFTMYNRDMSESFVWGGDHTNLGGAGSAILILDAETRTYRPPKTQDLLNLFKLIDNLPEISWMAPGMIVKDVPNEIVGTWRFYLRLKYGKKPSCADGLSEEDLLDNLDLLRVVRNSGEDFFKKPFSLVESCCTPPLNWTEEGASFLVQGARSKLPVVFIPMPFAGAGAPMTIAGVVVQHVAETLGGLTLVQLITPGIPAVYSGAPAFMDMRRATVALSPMEVQMVNMANTQMARFYNLPTATGDSAGHSDSKLNDYQSGMDATFSLSLASMAGNNAPLGVGFLANQEGYSLEKLVADCEVFRSIKKLLSGITINEDTLAFDVFKDVGPGGDFLSHKHTLRWFKKEYDYPVVFNRDSRTGWEAAGRKDTHSKARERVEALLKSSFNRLDPALDQELDRKMEGILKRRGISLDSLRHLLPGD